MLLTDFVSFYEAIYRIFSGSSQTRCVSATSEEDLSS